MGKRILALLLLLLCSSSISSSITKKDGTTTCLKPFGMSLRESLDEESCKVNSSSEEEEFYNRNEYVHIRNAVDGYNFYGFINQPGEGGLGAPCTSNHDCDTERLLICNEKKVCDCDKEDSIASQLSTFATLSHPLAYSKWNGTCEKDTDCKTKVDDNDDHNSAFLSQFYPLRCNEHGRCDCGTKAEENSGIYAGLCQDLCTCKVGTCYSRLDYKSPTRHMKGFLYARDPFMEPLEIE